MLARIGEVDRQGIKWASVRRPVAQGSSIDSSDSEVSTHGRGKSSLPTNSRWDTFRRLCLYYAECVRLDEKPFISGFADARGKHWVPLETQIDWRALSNQRTSPIAASEEVCGFARGNRQSRGAPALIIGVGVDVFTVNGQVKDGTAPPRILTPVLLVRVAVEMGDGAIRVNAISTPEINQNWLSRRFRQRDAQRRILDDLGILPSVATDAEDDGDDTPAGPSHFVPSIEQTLAKLYDLTQSRWKEYPNLSQLPREPALETVEQDGIYNRAVLMAIPDLKYAKRLYGELHRLAFEVPDAELDGTSLTNLFPHQPPIPQSQLPNNLPPRFFEISPLNEDQRSASEAAVFEPLLVVTGPPGTGKSTVVQTVLANLALQGRTGLFASRNHQGLEAVEPRLNALVEPEQLVLRPVYPFGERTKRFEWQRLMVTLLCRPRRQSAVRERDDALTSLNDLESRQRDAEAVVRTILDARNKLAEANQTAAEARAKLPAILASRTLSELEQLPIRPIARLLEVLRLARKLPWPIRVGVEPLAVMLARWRLKRHSSTPPTEWAREFLLSLATSVGSPDTAESTIAEVLRTTIEVERSIQSIEAKIRTHPPLVAACETVGDLRNEESTATISALRLIAQTAGAELSAEHRTALAKLRAGLENRGHDLGSDDPIMKELAKAFTHVMPELIKTFPLWAVPNLSVSKAIPFAPAVFDLVVVDEASQCDIPSVVPLLFRAKRLMVVGDPMQLPHVTQISRDADMNVRRRLGVHGIEVEDLTYAANSLFDVASTRPSAKLIELRSHYRCDPDIAAYSNEMFYNKTLWIRTSRQTGSHSSAGRPRRYGLHWTDVQGEVVRAAQGCYCPAQIEAIVKELVELDGIGFDGSVGVVTPFRVHADRLRDRIHEHLDRSALKRWRLIVDTADGFQGDERDLILFSLVGGDGMPDGSLGFLRAGPNRFNVAVSRARQALHVLGDSQWAEGCGIHFISDLLRRCREKPPQGRIVRHDLVGPVWEPRLAEALRSRGLPVEQQYPAAGYFLDIGLLREGMKLDVEVDGEAHHRDPLTGARRIDDIYRDSLLQSLHWQVIRFWVYELREDFDGCVQRVERAFRGE